MMISFPFQNGMNTASPSVVGVAEACELSGRNLTLVPGMLRFHNSLPVLASKHSSERSFASGVAVCRKMRSPQTIGLECPSPGIAVFQRTLSALNLMGIFLSLEVPEPLGPRKRSQLSAKAAEVLSETKPRTKRRREVKREGMANPRCKV